MSKPNPLYSFISNYFPVEQNEATLFYYYPIKRKINQHHENYLLIDINTFDQQIKIVLDNDIRIHQIGSLHVSVYQFIDPQIGYSSHYHIVLQCHDRNTGIDGPNVHLYFDKNHNLLSKPVIKDNGRLQIEGTSGNSFSDHELLQFTSVAKDNAMPSIQRFELERKKYIAELNEQYLTMISNYYNSSFEKQMEIKGNLQLLDNAILLLTQIQIMDGNYRYEKQLRRLQRYQTILMDALKPTVNETLIVSPVMTGAEAHPNFTLLPTINDSTSNNTKKIHQIDKMTKTFVMLEAQLESFSSHLTVELEAKATDIAQKWKELLERYLNAAENMMVFSKAVVLPGDQLSKVLFHTEFYFNQYELFCITTLQRLLESNQFNLALSLKPYTALLPDSVLIDALKSADDKESTQRVRFILENSPKIQAINTMLIQISSDQKPVPLLSAVFYLKKINCFKFLIKECHADPLVPDKEGLPLAHHIFTLSFPNEFMVVLNLNLPENQNKFYNKLITLLKLHPDHRNQLDAIISYQNLVNTGRLTNKHSSAIEAIKPLAEEMILLYSKKYFDKLMNSARCVETLMDIIEQVSTIESLSVQTKAPLHKAVKDTMFSMTNKDLTYFQGCPGLLRLIMMKHTEADIYSFLSRKQARLDCMINVIQLKKELGITSSDKGKTAGNSIQKDKRSRLTNYEENITRLQEHTPRVMSIVNEATTRWTQQNHPEYSEIRDTSLSSMAYCRHIILNKMDLPKNMSQIMAATDFHLNLISDDYWAASTEEKSKLLTAFIANELQQVAAPTEKETLSLSGP